MKASDLAEIPDPHTRMVQATRFLRWLAVTQREVTDLRDEALRQCVDEHKETQLSVAESLGLANQRISQLVKRARLKYEASSPPFPISQRSPRR